MAPTAGKYYLVASGSNVGTFSIDASTVDTLTFTIGSESLPTSAKAKKKFTVSAKVKKVYDGLTVPVRFYITKKASNGKYKPFTSKLASSYGDDELGAYTKYSLKTSLSKKGTYRIRARFQDVAHKAIYTSNKTIKIK
jgi:hypothetical protein